MVVLVEEKWLVVMQVDLEFILVTYTGEHVLIAVQTNAAVQVRMKKGNDWSLVFSVPKKHVKIARKICSDLFRHSTWQISSRCNYTGSMDNLPKSVNLIPAGDIWRVDDLQQRPEDDL